MIAVNKTLYEQDYHLWLSQTVEKLRSQQFSEIDWENLIEELEALGRSERQQLRNRLNTLIEHLLKRLYVNLPNDFNGWERTIREQRKQIIWLLSDSPSLKSIWGESFDTAWLFAIRDVAKDYPGYQFPAKWQFSSDPDELLYREYWVD
ncbi:DUF29 domain-containing protein [Pseudanabaena sp. PCC 6802]|uniref:DUF29 domain-containing protein n=1 Tax=Pseudanabaena sp. PCC 6802 TaxID=118173 RepID=UPI00034BCD42|nr:DUF29 domain-containing protein [Pseudanabaena sp. PCC 6802]